MTQKGQHIHWLYLWLAISAAGNIIGMASLVEGLVTWADFFKHIIELYRDNIRAPVAWLGDHLWPFGKLPGWFFDIVIWNSIVLLSANIYCIMINNKTIFYALIDSDDPVWDKVAFITSTIIAVPVALIVFVSQRYIERIVLGMRFEVNVKKYGSQGERADIIRHAMDVNKIQLDFSIDMLSYVATIVATFIIILLINYQVLKFQAPH